MDTWGPIFTIKGQKSKAAGPIFSKFLYLRSNFVSYSVSLRMIDDVVFFKDIKQSPKNPNLYWHVLISVMWTTVLLTRKQYNISSQPRLWRKNNTEGKVFILFSLVDTVWVVLDLYPNARSNLPAPNNNLWEKSNKYSLKVRHGSIRYCNLTNCCPA